LNKVTDETAESAQLWGQNNSFTILGVKIPKTVQNWPEQAFYSQIRKVLK